MGQLDKNVFGKKKFSDILEEIYQNQKKKEEQISTLISELKPLIQDIGDATLVVPLLKEYLEISVKNDKLNRELCRFFEVALFYVWPPAFFFC